MLDMACLAEVNRDICRWRYRFIDIFVRFCQRINKGLALRRYNTRLDNSVNDEQTALVKQLTVCLLGNENHAYILIQNVTDVLKHLGT